MFFAFLTLEWGPGKPTKSHHGGVSPLPPPVLAIKRAAGQSFEQQFVMAGWARSEEGVFPALAGAVLTSNHQSIFFEPQFGRLL